MFSVCRECNVTLTFVPITLLNGTMTNRFLSFLKSTYVAFVSKMNLIGRKKEEESFHHKLTHKQLLWQKIPSFLCGQADVLLSHSH